MTIRLWKVMMCRTSIATVASLVLLCTHFATADAQTVQSTTETLTSKVPSIDVHSRPQIKRDVDRYVSRVTEASIAANDQPMLQWNAPICPMVAGLPHDWGLALFDHFNQVIDSLGRPRARVGCKPNFFIFAIFHPQARLRALWESHPTAFSYSEDGIETFLNSTDPVRVWYSSREVDLDGAATLDSSVVLDRLFYGVPTFISHGNGRSLRSTFLAVPDLKSVIVIIDADQIDGIEVAQLSEYIAMAGLSKVDLDGRYADVPTILQLFSSPRSDRPQGLSTWDRSFLHAVYQTDQTSRHQRGAIADHMAEDLTR